ncbi:(S)-benzoin forming benzil reductase [Evansella sp. LMS18]|uniref:(S)-benzoin forming benzil reductase n=1 Tax=Evansella sp. LMS18 TaxID=2924033 RepID=UPI0020D1DED2|nr:(S)-benzoin forming benzil reductase [Evansella sp. LMS18]UTR08928.1 (S)-benzoin forming benzil reductase [Evansella sp. LMS18]
MKYIIITGASRGLGKATAELFLEHGYHVISVARSENEGLAAKASEKGAYFTNLQYDLSDTDGIAGLMNDVFQKINTGQAEEIHLINNAGILDPIKPVERSSAREIKLNINVNLIAPMVMVSEFMKHAADLPTEKRIINISSGAGRHPVYGWGCYGSSKAGLDLFSQTVSAEQRGKKFPVKSVSFAPGIIDTDMQKQIRATDKEDFADVERFKEYKEEEQLLPPEKVAGILVELIENESFPDGRATSVNEFLN